MSNSEIESIYPQPSTKWFLEVVEMKNETVEDWAKAHGIGIGVAFQEGDTWVNWAYWNLGITLRDHGIDLIRNGKRHYTLFEKRFAASAIIEGIMR